MVCINSANIVINFGDRKNWQKQFHKKIYYINSIGCIRLFSTCPRLYNYATIQFVYSHVNGQISILLIFSKLTLFACFVIYIPFSQVEQSQNRMVVIGRSSPGREDCVEIQRVDGSMQSYSLTLPNDDEFCGTSVTICVRYIFGGCSSTEFRGSYAVSYTSAYTVWYLYASEFQLNTVHVLDTVGMDLGTYRAVGHSINYEWRKPLFTCSRIL